MIIGDREIPVAPHFQPPSGCPKHSIDSIEQCGGPYNSSVCQEFCSLGLAQSARAEREPDPRLLQAFNDWRRRKEGYETVTSRSWHPNIGPHGEQLTLANGTVIEIRETIAAPGGKGERLIPFAVTVPDVGHWVFYQPET